MEMKILFESENKHLAVGINEDNDLTIEISGLVVGFEPDEAEQFYSVVGKKMEEIRSTERKKLPIWRRIIG